MPPRFRLRYAQHTKTHSIASGPRRILSLPISSTDRTKGTLGAELGGQRKGHERCAGSDEHSASFPVPGSESGHVVQVRQRTKDSGFQARQSLALQEVEARSVDGREVRGRRTPGEAETKGGHEGCGTVVRNLP